MNLFYQKEQYEINCYLDIGCRLGHEVERQSGNQSYYLCISTELLYSLCVAFNLQGEQDPAAQVAPLLEISFYSFYKIDKTVQEEKERIEAEEGPRTVQPFATMAEWLDQAKV